MSQVRMKMSMAIKCTILAFFTVAILGCGKGEDRQAKYLQEAKDYFAEENYDKARIEAKNVLQINPKNIEARQIIGEISFIDGDIRSAYGMFLSVLEIEPDNLAANLAMEKIHLGVKDFERVIEYANKVTNVSPGHIEALGMKALALSETGEKEQALEVAREVISNDPGNAPAVAVIVHSLFAEDKKEEALKVLVEAESVNPAESKLSLMKISIYESLGRTSDVEAELAGLVKRYPDDDSYVTALANYLIRSSKIEEAETVLRKYSADRPDEVEPRLTIVAFLLKHVSQESAIEQVEKYIAEFPDESKYRLGLAQLYLFTGAESEAEGVLSSTIDRDPRSVASLEARNMLVVIKLKENDRDAADKLLEEILEIEPENVLALLARARLSIAAGDTKPGIADLRTVLKNEPDSVPALKMLAGAQEREGNDELALDNYKKLMTLQNPDLATLGSAARLAIGAELYQEAENYIRAALELDSDNPGLVTNLIRLLVLKEDWSTAEKFIQRLIDNDDSSALGYYLDGGLKSRFGEREESLRSYKKSLEIEPKAVESLTAVAQEIVAQQGLEQAIDFVSAHCETHPDQSHCPYILGSMQAQNGDYDKAETTMRKSLNINPGLIASYRQLAKIYSVQSEPEKAEKILVQGIQKTQSPLLQFELASFYLATRNYDAAIESYNRMLEKEPENLAVKNNLAMIYVEFRDSAENLATAKKYIADLQDADNPAYLDTVGWVFYKTGDFSQAVTYLQAALNKVDSSPLLEYHLGMALLKSGDEVGARQHLELATANPDANYNGIEEARQALRDLQ